MSATRARILNHRERNRGFYFASTISQQCICTVARSARRRLHKELAAARTPTEKTPLQRQIEATDRQIDRLVYELYGLSEEEIRIVEGAG